MFTSILANPLVKYLTAALAAVLIIIGAYVFGRTDGVRLTESKFEIERARWVTKVAEVQGAADSIALQASRDFLQQKEVYDREIQRLRDRKLPVRVVTKTVEKIVEKEVERIVRVYVPQTTDYPVSKGFVELHNTAAAGLPLREEQKPDAGEATDKRLSDVGETVAANYYSCNATRAQLASLQKVVADFQKKQQELSK